MKATKLVQLMNSQMCQDCRFNKNEEVKDPKTGEVVATVVCTRGDCDNWITSTIKPFKRDENV